MLHKEFKAESIYRNKEGYYVMEQDTICRDSIVINLNSPENIAAAVVTFMHQFDRAKIWSNISVGVAVKIFFRCE